MVCDSRSIILTMEKIRILVICAANICRSPMVEGLIRHRVLEAGLKKRILVDSAGTRASQPRHKPDARTQKLMAVRGVSLRGIKARQVKVKDMVRNDFILAMDNANFNDLLQLCPPEHQFKIKLLMNYAPELGVEEVPDPYYGTMGGFEEVLRLAEVAVDNLLKELVETAREY